MMMRTLRGLMLLGGVLAGTAAAGAQQQQVNQGVPGARVAALRNQIEEVYRRRIRGELGLTAEVAPRVERIIAAWGQQRTQLDRQERALRNEINGHLRPGIAANDSALVRAIDALNDNRIAYAETFRDEMRELTPLLTPVQRGRYHQMRERFLQQVANAQQAVQPEPPPVRPGGARPGRGGGLRLP